MRAKRAFDALAAAPMARQPNIASVIERTPTFVKATPLEFPEPCTGEDALVATVGNCLSHLWANEDCARAGSDPEGVHQMRVALRRLDACLTVYKPLIPLAQVERLQRLIKGIAQSLGSARDWDVFIADMLDPVAANMPNDPDLKLLRTVALKQRAAAYRDMHKALAAESYSEMWREIVAWLSDRDWRQQPVTEVSASLMADVHSFSETVLDKVHRKLLKRGKGFAVLDARERHKLRVRIKKVRYASEFFSPLYRVERDSEYLVALRAMQEDLGRLNDVESARGLLDGLETEEPKRARRIARAGGLVVGWHRHAASMREERLVQHWHELKKTKPFWH
jgi:CHAD domain-containing protein